MFCCSAAQSAQPSQPAQPAQQAQSAQSAQPAKAQEDRIQVCSVVIVQPSNFSKNNVSHFYHVFSAYVFQIHTIPCVNKIASELL